MWTWWLQLWNVFVQDIGLIFPAGQQFMNLKCGTPSIIKFATIDIYHSVLCFVDLHSCTIFQINPNRCTVLLSIFISLLYMFRATMCPSSEEITVSMRHWYLSLCMGGVWSAGWSFTPPSTQYTTHTEWQIPVSHRYSNFSWWWTHGCPKHVEKRN
jgi:hypothetical protein